MAHSVTINSCKTEKSSHLPDPLLHLLVTFVSYSEPSLDVCHHCDPLLLPRLLLVQPFFLERRMSFIIIHSKIMNEAVSVVMNIMDIELRFFDIIIVLPASLVIDDNQVPAADGVSYLRAVGL